MIDRKGFTIWFTGLSLTTKSLLAEVIEGELLERGLNVEILDEETVDPILGSKPAESIEEIRKNLKKIQFICKLLTRNGVIAIVSAISPTIDIRNEMREGLENFIEVYVKGNTANQDFVSKVNLPDIDIEAIYEEPLNSEVIIESDKELPDASAKKIIKTLELLNWIPKVEYDDYSPEEEAKIQERLESLGYL
jgi:adenylylsulfate kinase